MFAYVRKGGGRLGKAKTEWPPCGLPGSSARIMGPLKRGRRAKGDGLVSAISQQPAFSSPHARSHRRAHAIREASRYQ